MKRATTAALKKIARATALPVARAMARHKNLKQLARTLLGRVPALEKRVDALIGRTPLPPPRPMHVPQDSNDLSPATQVFYEELKRHLKIRKP